MIFHHHISKMPNMAIPQTFRDFSVHKMDGDVWLKSTKHPFINKDCVTDLDREGRLGMTQADPEIPHPLCHDRAVKITHSACKNLFPNQRRKGPLWCSRKITYLVNISQLWFSLNRPPPFHVYMQELLIMRSWLTFGQLFLFSRSVCHSRLYQDALYSVNTVELYLLLIKVRRSYSNVSDRTAEQTWSHEVN